MARDARYKWWAEENREYLFDLETDPLEMRNLAARPEHRDTLNQMREKMLTELRSSQLNLSEGYVPKVQRLRAEEKTKGKATDDQSSGKAKLKKQK
jgi:hypothetical protein